MKKLFTFIALIVITTINAQAPQGFNYQATVRNSSGALVVNQNVLFKFNIMLNSQTSLPVYSETHQAPTDDLGQVNLTIGSGTPTTGTFSSINWGNGSYFLGIELNTGAGYVAMGTTQLLSVPYALYANTAGSTSSNNTGLISPTITTNPVANIIGTTATFSASISNANINQLKTTAGFVYSLNPNPIYEFVSFGGGNALEVNLSSNTFTFDSAVQGYPDFSPNTLYYVRAFVVTENNIIVYGNEISFVTSSFIYPNQIVTDLLIEFNKLTNDIFGIIEDQESATYYNPNSDFSSGYIPTCATITRVPGFGTAPTVGQTVTKTIDFGSSGCILLNNNFVRGKIIITYVYTPSATSHTINFAFDDFFHNGFSIQGSKTITRTFQTSSVFSTPHTIQTLDVDFSISDISGEYSFIGSKIRELISGENTQNLYDNFYKETGLWTCNNIYNIPISNSVNSPLQIDLSCNFNNISGVMTSSTSNHNYVLDYGTGGCDNNATITIDGSSLTNLTF
jgi:hypothetical protein